MSYVATTYKFTTKIEFIEYESGSQLDYGDCLTAIAIQKKYQENIFPLYVLTLQITKEQKRYLSSHKFYILLKIYRCNYNDSVLSDDDISSSDPVTDKIITNILLRPFDPSVAVYQTNTNDTSNDEETTTEQKEEYVLNCIPMEDLQINNTIINDVYAKANLTEIMINMISELYTKEIYLQSPTNTNRYDTLLIPPLSLVPALRYLQSNYMIYNNNINIFFDSSKMYVYDIFDTDREFTNSLFLEIQQNSDSTQDIFNNIYVDEENNIKKYYNQNPLFISKKDVYRYTTGDQIVYNSYDSNFNLTSRTYNLTDSGNKNSDKKTRYIWNINQQQVFEEPIKNNIYTYTTITLYNIDSSLFSPATYINLSGCLNTNYNGIYLLINSEEYYSSTDKKNFNNSVTLTLLKK